MRIEKISAATFFGKFGVLALALTPVRRIDDLIRRLLLH
jgi:hypothetical protein